MVFGKWFLDAEDQRRGLNCQCLYGYWFSRKYFWFLVSGLYEGWVASENQKPASMIRSRCHHFRCSDDPKSPF